MTQIKIETRIKAPIERVFDLARSIDLHQMSTTGTNEEAIAGRTSGLIELGETVTWKAKHFGIYQKLTAKIIEFERPTLFVDVMLKGAFKSMKHTHQFTEIGEGTMMTDVFEFTSPFGIIGKIADGIFLKNYMTKFLLNKNEELKNVAESEQWKKVLGQ